MRALGAETPAGRALGAAIPFALEVIAALEGQEAAQKVKSSIVYNH